MTEETNQFYTRPKELGIIWFYCFCFRSEETPESIFSKKTEKKRSKLVLPAPQISEKEMEEIIKIGQATESVKEMSDENPTRLTLS